jgi:hypothetical protein
MMRRTAGPPRPKVSFDGTTVSTVLFDPQPLTAANLATTFYAVDCSSTGGANRTISGITGLYSEYRYNSISIDWIPSVGPSNADSGSRIFFGYLEGPERMALFLNGATPIATRVAMVKGLRNVRSCNAWERFTYNVPLTWRRKVFDVNLTAGASVDELERSTQGMVIIAIESITGVVVLGGLGQFKVTSSTRLSNLELAGPV